MQNSSSASRSTKTQLVPQGSFGPTAYDLRVLLKRGGGATAAWVLGFISPPLGITSCIAMIPFTSNVPSNIVSNIFHRV